MKLKYLIFLGILSAITFDANAVVVSHIDVTGNQRMDAESVRILSDVRVGDNIDSEKANTIAKKLQSSGYFSSVNVKLDGNVLRIKLTESPIINMITIEGNDEIDTDDLKKEIRIKERSSYDTSVIGGDVQRMHTALWRSAKLWHRCRTSCPVGTFCL